MIDPKIRRYLGIPEDNASDYLYIVLPELALSSQGVLDWIQANSPRGCQAYQHLGNVILQINNLGRKILTKALLDAATDTHGAILKGKPCICVEVNTTMLSADVPIDYSPNGQILDEEGEVVRQKTVDELMLCIPGDIGKSIILCVEKDTPDGNGNPEGLQMDQLLRFRTQFPAYYVFSDEQISAWRLANQTQSD